MAMYTWYVSFHPENTDLRADLQLASISCKSLFFPGTCSQSNRKIPSRAPHQPHWGRSLAQKQSPMLLVVIG